MSLVNYYYLADKGYAPSLSTTIQSSTAISSNNHSHKK